MFRKIKKLFGYNGRQATDAICGSGPGGKMHINPGILDADNKAYRGDHSYQNINSMFLHGTDTDTILAAIAAYKNENGPDRHAFRQAHLDHLSTSLGIRDHARANPRVKDRWE